MDKVIIARYAEVTFRHSNSVVMIRDMHTGMLRKAHFKTVKRYGDRKCVVVFWGLEEQYIAGYYE